ncbi:MAG: cyclic nucleotide-binding protein [Methylomonas sp.]|jgi:CRP-like cAMP-binding protein|nr:MAG: cyclic nucleotide-binding protein [Methylomonas sp.]
MKHLLDEILSSPRLLEGVAWKYVKYKAGEKIFQKGDVGSAFFLIDEGNVRVLSGDEHDVDILLTEGLCDLSKGDIFGDICLYGTHRRSASVVALSEIVLVEIRNDMLSVYLDDHPIEGYLFLKALSEITASRLEAANDRIEYLLRSNCL